MKNSLTDKIPFVVSIIFFVFTALTYLIILWLNNGGFVYVLDDPYIHMTIAKHLALEGKWAVNGMDFSSAASSPLWSLLITGIYMVTGVNVYVPLILNLILSVACIYAAYGILKSFGVNKYLYIILFVFVFAAPLPVLMFTGMEHILQILLVLLFAFVCSRIISAENTPVFGYVQAFILALLLASVRYEDVFIIAVAVILLLRRKKYPASVILISGAAIPILIYGYVSASNGWLFVPNPLLVKFKVPGFNIIEILKILPRAAKRMLEPDLIFLLPPLAVSVIMMAKSRNYLREPKSVLLILFCGSYLLHMMFAQTGWFYRYEAYLVSLGMAVLIIYLNGAFNRSGTTENALLRIFYRYRKIVYAVMIISIAVRFAPDALIPLASNNIYEQQFQMARFINGNAAGKTIAANDIGILCFYTNSRVVDLWGLADIDVGKLKIAGKYNPTEIDKITKKHNTELVIVYEHWFDQYGGLPTTWKKLGSWEMTRPNFVCGTTSVDFYVTNSENADMFSERLRKFSTELPSSVRSIQY
jgi:hypothetical protein